MARASALLLMVVGLATWAAVVHWREDRPSTQDTQKQAGNKTAPTSQGRVSARDQVIAWLKANSTYVGEPNPVVADITRQLDLMLPGDKAFTLLLGAKLVKADRSTLVAGRQADFFALRYQPEAPGIPPYNLSLMVTDPQSQEFHPDPPVTLADLHIDHAHGLDANLPVKGTVGYRCRTPVRGNALCVRLTYMFGKKTITRYFPRGSELEGEGRWPFVYDPVDADLAEPTGAHVLFFDFCSVKEPGQKAEAWILSNTVADVVLLKNSGVPKKKAGQDK